MFFSRMNTMVVQYCLLYLCEINCFKLIWITTKPTLPRLYSTFLSTGMEYTSSQSPTKLRSPISIYQHLSRYNTKEKMSGYKTKVQQPITGLAVLQLPLQNTRRHSRLLQHKNISLSWNTQLYTDPTLSMKTRGNSTRELTNILPLKLLQNYRQLPQEN